MNPLIQHAMNEFQYAGWVDENGVWKDDMQQSLCENIMKMLDVFSEEGHSGSSAPYAINLFKRLASWEIIGPLTGADEEWNEVSDGVFQNKRCTAVFKQADRFDGKPYWLNGKVFWEWAERDLFDDEPGYPGTKIYKSYFTSGDSSVPIELPWTQPEKSEYVFRPTEEFPNEVL